MHSFNWNIRFTKFWGPKTDAFCTKWTRIICDNLRVCSNINTWYILRVKGLINRNTKQFRRKLLVSRKLEWDDWTKVEVRWMQNAIVTTQIKGFNYIENPVESPQISFLMNSVVMIYRGSRSIENFIATLLNYVCPCTIFNIGESIIKFIGFPNRPTNNWISIMKNGSLVWSLISSPKQIRRSRLSDGDVNDIGSRFPYAPATSG